MARPFHKYKDESFWRKISMASWDHPRDPQIYAALDIDATAMMKVIGELREKGADVKVTPVHFVGKGVADAITLYPEINGIIVRGSVRVRDSIDIWFNVMFDSGDLFGAKIEAVDQKSTTPVAQELADGAARIRDKGDKRLRSYDRLTKWMPAWLLRRFLWLSDVLNFRLGIPLKWAGVERDPFGTILVTNIGTFDMVHAFAPIPPMMRLPGVVVVGRVHDKPVAVDGKVVVRPVLPISITVDHRYLDGFHAARMAQAFQGFLEDEEKLRASLEREAVVAVEATQG